MFGIAARGNKCGKHLPGLLQRGGAEKNPADTDQGQRHDPGHNIPWPRWWFPVQPAFRLLGLTLENQENAVIATPYQKQQAGLVPDTEQGHRND